MKKEQEPHDWKEGRRLRAWELWQQGWKQKDRVRALGVSKGAVSQWLKRGKTEGKPALHRHPTPGAQPKLSAEHLAEFRLDPYPVATYRIQGVELERTLCMLHSENSVVVRYALLARKPGASLDGIVEFIRSRVGSSAKPASYAKPGSYSEPRQ